MWSYPSGSIFLIERRIFLMKSHLAGQNLIQDNSNRLPNQINYLKTLSIVIIHEYRSTTAIGQNKTKLV